MYGKLIIRDLKHSIRNYLIYFLTLALTVGLFYGFLSISSRYFQVDFPVHYNLTGMQGSVKYAVTAIALLLMFLIRYVNRQMLEHKQREFALITLMGMEQRVTARLFFCETFLIGLVAIGLGVLVGTLFSQIVSAIVLHLYGLTYQFQFSLYPDTLLTTFLLFLCLFLVVGLGNVRTIQKRKIIDMLNEERKVDSDFKKEKSLLPWVLISDIGALYMCGFGWYGVYSGTLQDFQASLLFSLYCGAALPSLFLIVSALFLQNCIRGKPSPHWIALLAGIGLLNAVSALHLFQLLHMTDFYPVLAILFFLFGIFAFFDCLSGLVLWIKRKFPRLRYRHLFLFGQLTSKLKTTSRTMGVLSIVLLGAAAFLAFAQPIAESKSSYQATRITTDFVIIDRWWLTDSIDELPKADFSYAFVDEYLKNSGSLLQDSAAVKFYFLNNMDFNRRISNGAPEPEVALGISLSDYNHLRRMTGFPEIRMMENQFSLHCGYGSMPDMADTFLRQYPTLMVGKKQLSYSGVASYENVGEFVSSSYYSPTVVLPDSVCLELTVAEIKYFGNTVQPLPYEFIRPFDQSIREIIQSKNLLKIAPKFSLVVTKTEQVNESIMWAVLLTLVFTYLGMVLLVTCFTILSLQQLSDSAKHRSRFQVLHQLGFSQTNIHHIILKQLGLWFGVPMCFSLLGVGVILSIIMKNSAITAYVGKQDLLFQVGFALLLLFVLFLCYFISTYLLFLWNVERKS